MFLSSHLNYAYRIWGLQYLIPTILIKSLQNTKNVVSIITKAGFEAHVSPIENIRKASTRSDDSNTINLHLGCFSDGFTIKTLFPALTGCMSERISCLLNI